MSNTALGEGGEHDNESYLIHGVTNEDILNNLIEMRRMAYSSIPNFDAEYIN